MEGPPNAMIHTVPCVSSGQAQPAPAAADATLLARARDVLPGVTQTYSKSPDQHVEGYYPVFLDHGKGCRVWSVSGESWIDYPMALGAVILGYGHPGVDAAVHFQVDRGPVFSLGHELEVEVAERVVAMVPCAESVRFLKTGSEAMTGAVRLARAATGRDHVAQCGYHGWHDWAIGHTARNAGVPVAVRALTHVWSYNDLESLERIFVDFAGEVAAVTMEPIGVVAPNPGFLEGVRSLCDQHGAVLIFDEVITGFRLAPGGAQEFFGVTPDIAAFGKAMANGYPLAAIAGRRDIMKLIETTAFISSTFGGETVSLAAARVVLDQIRSNDVIGSIWHRGQTLLDGFNEIAARYRVPVRMIGLAPRRVLEVTTEEGLDASVLKGLIWQGCLDRGILLGNANLVSTAHDDAAIDLTLRAFDETLQEVGAAYEANCMVEALKGSAPGAVFRRP